MALPVMSTPTYELTIPSSKAKVKFRPFLVKEEKSLMIAQQSEEVNVMYDTLKNIIHDCTFKKIDIEQLAIFDIEYIFCQLRAKSVGEISNLVFNCLECNDPKGKMQVNIDLTTINVEFDKDHQQNIDLFDDVGIKMKYPGIQMLKNAEKVEGDNIEAVMDVIVDSIECIYTKDEIFPAKEQTKEELKQFLDNLTQEQFKKIQVFFDTMPKFKKDVEFDCPNCGYHHKHTLEGLESFF
jgi:rubrerythrin